MTDGMQFTIREWLTSKRLGLHLLGFGIAVALLAYLGPFGTWSSLTAFDRVVFWSISVGLNWVAAQAVFILTMERFRARRWPVWAGLLLASLITAVPGTGAVWVVVAAYLDQRPTLGAGFGVLYTQVAVLHLVIGSAVWYFIERTLLPPDGAGELTAGEGAAHGTSRDAPGAALVARLGARVRGDLLHLRMQDHYVEVHTDAGKEMLLLRFRDALREVEGLDGMQVHRSHWVARAAVHSVERRAGRVVLRLVNGEEVPVSRSYAPELKDRGWI